MNKKLIIFLVVLAVLGGIFVFLKKAKQPEVATSQLNQPTAEDSTPSVSNNKTNAEVAKPSTLSTSNWQIYESDKNSFRIKYPENWIYGEEEQDKMSTVMFAIKNGNPNETNLRVDVVAIADVPENLNTLEKILTAFNAESKKSGESISNYKDSKVTLSGISTVHITNNYVIPQTNPPEKYISSAYFLSKNGKMYSLLIKAKTPDTGNAKIMEDIVKTFQFK